MGFCRKTQGPCSRENIGIVRDSQTRRQGDEFLYSFCQLRLTPSPVRHTRVERARVATDPTRLVRVQHHRGRFQQVHLLVRYPLCFRPIRFPRIDRYPELRELELRQLERVLLLSEPGLLKAKIKAYAHGELPHAENILSALYDLMESDESVKETPVPVVPHPRVSYVSLGALQRPPWRGPASYITNANARISVEVFSAARTLQVKPQSNSGAE